MTSSGTCVLRARRPVAARPKRDGGVGATPRTARGFPGGVATVTSATAATTCNRQASNAHEELSTPAAMAAVHKALATPAR